MKKGKIASCLLVLITSSSSHLLYAQNILLINKEKPILQFGDIILPDTVTWLNSRDEKYFIGNGIVGGGGNTAGEWDFIIGPDYTSPNFIYSETILFKIDDELQTAITRALQQKDIADENERLKEALDRRFGLESIVSHDLRMLKIFEMIDNVADSRASILITGENGTGKSMIARAIHKKSSRRNAPFVEVACGALPDTLLESELFGHMAGSFTGATHNKVGKFQLSDKGTIFLDEIGTATQALQVKLLRVLQELQFEPLGGIETISVDTRTILATNENLDNAVAEGRFRQDLFYRVNVIHIELPSLRERPDDIPLLAEHFLRTACKEFARDVEGFTLSAMNTMLSHAWPGNIRELENVIQRAVLLTKSRNIDCESLPRSVLGASNSYAQSSTGPSNSLHTTPLSQVRNLDSVTNHAAAIHQTLSEALEGPERQIILDVLKANDWNRNVTADQLGINRTTLYKKMKKLGIESLA